LKIRFHKRFRSWLSNS